MYGFADSHSRRFISGASLAQCLRHLPPPVRAVWGADIVDGHIVVTIPTVRSVAATVNVNATYLFAALRLAPEARMTVERGERPLIVPRQRRLIRLPVFDGTSPRERLAGIVAELGEEVTLDLLANLTAEKVSVAA
jgi:hypothetical protein